MATKNLFAALTVPKSKMASIILKWRKFGKAVTPDRGLCSVKVAVRGGPEGLVEYEKQDSLILWNQELFGLCPKMSGGKLDTVHHLTSTTPAVTHGGGSIRPFFWWVSGGCQQVVETGLNKGTETLFITTLSRALRTSEVTLLT